MWKHYGLEKLKYKKNHLKREGGGGGGGGRATGSTILKNGVKNVTLEKMRTRQSSR
jgi:hypothetical protein